ncbi:MAG: 2-(1,2-epoxy-1,2-dihydrophenyl)acetyl-CoA isomerase [Flavobacteriales bacterium]|nr:2-(1,2-epoxy-1,2-dihydrophenyl)acetyl-CoA isomerase [Flavobacteriales bacterium]
MSSSIQFEKHNGVGIITLNRPDVLNSFNTAMAKQCQDALDQCATDQEIRSVMITGAGRAFCAGQDLEEALDPNMKLADIVNNTYNPIIRKIRQLEKPVVCAVNGVAAGAGANIAFACDITIAAESANFIQSFANIGLIPDSGGTYFLPRLVGMQKATAMAMLAEKISAEKAAELGLIYQHVPDTELSEAAMKLAVRLASLPTRGLALTKKAFMEGMNNTLDQQLELEAQLQAEAGATSDHREGVNAFLEKRKPQFTGA